MVPQGHFLIAAKLAPERVDALRDLLATMTDRPGHAVPDNPLVPFGAFDTLHFARFVILEDATRADAPAGGDAPIWLTFFGDCDGPGEAMIETLAERAGPGLSRIFGHCTDFRPRPHLARWLQLHAIPPAVNYVNWVGRSVTEIREEAALHRALRRHLDAAAPASTNAKARRAALLAAVRADGTTLTPRAPTPRGWLAGEIAHALLGVMILLAALPFVLLLPLFLIELRHREMIDPVIAPRPDPAHTAALAIREDHDVTNQFSAFGTVKPGWFRGWTLVALLWVVNLTTRHIYVRGRLARVGTIHFARWVFLDDRRRLLFASNYDGSLDSYMDDFINKVAFGLNLVFSNGIGYPRTRFLVFDGAKDEQGFKNYIRRHQLPTEVWYKAYPGLTAADLARNRRIREGVEAFAMTEAEAGAWLALI